MDEVYLSDKEAAEYLQVSTMTLWRVRREGKLCCYRVGGKRIFYKKSELDAYRESGRVVKVLTPTKLRAVS